MRARWKRDDNDRARLAFRDRPGAIPATSAAASAIAAPAAARERSDQPWRVAARVTTALARGSRKRVVEARVPWRALEDEGGNSRERRGLRIPDESLSGRSAERRRDGPSPYGGVDDALVEPPRR